MYKRFKGNLKYIMWQARKIKPNHGIFTETHMSDDCQTYTTTILMIEQNWTRW